MGKVLNEVKAQTLDQFLKSYLIGSPMAMGGMYREYAVIEYKDFEVFVELEKTGAGKFEFSYLMRDKDGKEFDDFFERYRVSGIKKQSDLKEYMKDKLDEFIEEFYPKYKEIIDLKESRKQFKSKAINETELTELKDAIFNREEFVDENVVGTSIGEDYIVSVFDKAVLIFTSDNTPFIIGREDLTDEEMLIVEELYSALEISVDIDGDDEEGEEEEGEIFVDDNTSDDLEMSEKSLKESSHPKADKELKSVIKYLKDEFEISSSEVNKLVHGNDYAEEQGYDYLYVGKATYKNEVSKDMLEEYKEWYEDVYGGSFDYVLYNKTIEFELGYGDDNDMKISMEKFMNESENKKKPNRVKKSLGESKKSKVKTLIKESGERVTTFKKGFDFKKYKSKA